MAQALGYVTRRDSGDYEGVLTAGLNAKINIVCNNAKSSDKQPDYRILAEPGGDIGGGWNKVAKTSGKPYVALSLAHPLLGQHRIFANLVANANGGDGEFAILWNPKD